MTADQVFAFDNCYTYVQNSTFYPQVSLWRKGPPIYNFEKQEVMLLKKVCYTVVLQSQLGPRSGELLMQEEARVVSGELFLLGRRNRFTGSVLQSGKYLISGALRSRMEKEPYDAIFTVRQGRLTGGLVTRHGCWDLTGIEAAIPVERLEPAAAGS